MKEEQNITHGKLFATGLSNGGNFAIRLALEAPEFHAVAAIGTNLPSEDNFDCNHSKRPVSFLLMNGTHDPVNPYNGGMVSLYGFGKRGNVQSSESTINYWIRNAKSEFTAEIRALPNPEGADKTHSIHQSWKSSKALIELITIQGGGHNIPGPLGSSNPLFGPRSRDYWSAIIIYDFFERVSLNTD